VWSAILGIVAVLVEGFGPPFGAMTLTLAIAVTFVALASGDLRFVPAAIATGLLVDAGLLVTRRWRARLRRVVVAAVVALIASLGFVLLTLGLQGPLDWPAELWLGALILAGLIGGFVGWFATWRRAPWIEAEP